MKVKEESEKVGLKLNIQKTKIMESGPISSVQFSSVTQSCPTLWDPMHCSTPGFPEPANSWSLLKLMSIESVMPANHLILCCPLFLLSAICPSIRVFSNQSTLHMRWPKYSFSISPSREHPGLISRLVGSPCSPRDSQESSPTLQFKSINSLVFSFLHSPTFISIHDHWKNHSLD